MGAHARQNEAASPRRHSRMNEEAVGGEEPSGSVLGRWDVGEVLGALAGQICVTVEVSAVKFSLFSKV